MNVYQCCYLGLRGYCCRSHNSRWMFVPELGQANNNIHKHISLNDLAFNNIFAKEYELNIQQIRSNPSHFIKALLFPAKKAGTVGGLLFATI
jgi:hypothetical protein